MPRIHQWTELTNRLETITEECHIALVGKYTGLSDSYLSILKALQHAAIAAHRKLVIDWVEAEKLQASPPPTSPSPTPHPRPTRPAHARTAALTRSTHALRLPTDAREYAVFSESPNCGQASFAACVHGNRVHAHARVACATLSEAARCDSEPFALRFDRTEMPMHRTRVSIVCTLSYVGAATSSRDLGGFC
jgi:hypothetical protein